MYKQNKSGETIIIALQAIGFFKHIYLIYYIF